MKIWLYYIVIIFFVLENCPAVVVVLHHTYDPDYIFPDSKRAISRSNLLAVDCLFHEDNGLLKCSCNTEALEATAKYLQDIKTNSTRIILNREWRFILRRIINLVILL